MLHHKTDMYINYQQNRVNRSVITVHHFKLFRKLIDRKTPIAKVRILLFWYSKQTVCITWGTCMSDYFCISIGVRQGGILSPGLFFVYVDDLSDKLIQSKTGGHIYR